jgi:stage II sporulation protein D (peptidoglycan lytic transglycosylase)
MLSQRWGLFAILLIALFAVRRLAIEAGTQRAATVRVQTVERGAAVVRTVPLEDYVETTIISEFAPAAGEMSTVERMLEVQAIISRTYAVSHASRHGRDGFDFCSTTHCQLYDPGRLKTSRWSAAAAEAIARTSGIVLWYGDAPAEAVFHSDCGGRTSAAVDVWGGPDPPYLRSVKDDVRDDAHTRWTFDVDTRALLAVLNADVRTRVGTRLDRIEVTERDEVGRARRVRIRGRDDRVVRGEDFREVVTRGLGVRTLRSTWFEVKSRHGTFEFKGRGYGHGVGLCQNGAVARLDKGATVREVLAKYFPGTKVVLLSENGR